MPGAILGSGASAGFAARCRCPVERGAGARSGAVRSGGAERAPGLLNGRAFLHRPHHRGSSPLDGRRHRAGPATGFPVIAGSPRDHRAQGSHRGCGHGAHPVFSRERCPIPAPAAPRILGINRAGLGSGKLGSDPARPRRAGPHPRATGGGEPGPGRGADPPRPHEPLQRPPTPRSGPGTRRSPQSSGSSSDGSDPNILPGLVSLGKKPREEPGTIGGAGRRLGRAEAVGARPFCRHPQPAAPGPRHRAAAAKGGCPCGGEEGDAGAGGCGGAADICSRGRLCQGVPVPLAEPWFMFNCRDFCFLGARPAPPKMRERARLLRRGPAPQCGPALAARPRCKAPESSSGSKLRWKVLVRGPRERFRCKAPLPRLGTRFRWPVLAPGSQTQPRYKAAVPGPVHSSGARSGAQPFSRCPATLGERSGRSGATALPGSASVCCDKFTSGGLGGLGSCQDPARPHRGQRSSASTERTSRWRLGRTQPRYFKAG